MLFAKKKTPKGIIGLDDAAKELGISLRTLWNRINDNNIPTTPKGTYISEDDLQTLKQLEKRRKERGSTDD